MFLDEVGDMTPLTQVKLLRVLQEKQIQRVGGNEVIPVDVRLLAATNSDLEKLVPAGRFRSDLYFRLNVFTIALPPLRERGRDLDLLIDFYLHRYGQELRKPVHPLPDTTRDAMRRYPWPGNVRELQSAIKQALLQMSGPVLLPEYLPAAVLRREARQAQEREQGKHRRSQVGRDLLINASMPAPKICMPNVSTNWKGN